MKSRKSWKFHGRADDRNWSTRFRMVIEHFKNLMWNIASHCITSHHIALHHIASHHITSNCITSHHIASHHIKLHHITSHCITLHHITSHYITLHHITSHRITSHHIASYHITSHHITLHYRCNSLHIHCSSHLHYFLGLNPQVVQVDQEQARTRFVEV